MPAPRFTHFHGVLWPVPRPSTQSRLLHVRPFAYFYTILLFRVFGTETRTRSSLVVFFVAIWCTSIVVLARF